MGTLTLELSPFRFGVLPWKKLYRTSRLLTPACMMEKKVKLEIDFFSACQQGQRYDWGGGQYFYYITAGHHRLQDCWRRNVQIVQVLRNLISNWLKFSKDNKGISKNSQSPTVDEGVLSRLCVLIPFFFLVVVAKSGYTSFWARNEKQAQSERRHHSWQRHTSHHFA